MNEDVFIRSVEIAAPAEVTFAWHARPGAFHRLKPPWEKVRVIEHVGGIEDGARVRLRIGGRWLGFNWSLVHRDHQAGRQFRDVQVRGPFASYDHRHRIDPLGADRSVLEDRVTYRLPVGRIGRMLGAGITERKFERLFRYRHRITRDDIEAHVQRADVAMRIGVAGAAGLLGSALVPALQTCGHQVRVLDLAAAGAGEEVSMRPVGPDGLENDSRGLDAVVHLPAAADGAQETARLCAALARLDQPPRVFVHAGTAADSAAHREATAPLARRGARIVSLRLGNILSATSGPLRRLLAPLRLGLGVRFMEGSRLLSWVALDDAVGAVQHVLSRDDLAGSIDVASPEPATLDLLTRTLSRVLGRPAWIPLRDAAVRTLVGSDADALLSGADLRPVLLERSGYRHRCPDLEDALCHLLGR